MTQQDKNKNYFPPKISSIAIFKKLEEGIKIIF